MGVRMTKRLQYGAFACISIALGVFLYNFELGGPEAHSKEVDINSFKIKQPNPLTMSLSLLPLDDKKDTSPTAQSKSEIDIISVASELSSLTLGDQFQLLGISDSESLVIDITVTQLDKNDQFSLMYGSIAGGGTAIITLGGQSVNVFLKTSEGLFEFGGKNFDGNVPKLADIKWGDDIYEHELPKTLPPDEPTPGIRLIEP